MDHEHDNSASESLQRLIENSGKDFDRIGFHIIDAQAMPTNFEAFAEKMQAGEEVPDPYEMLQSGESGVVLNVRFYINKTAFSDKVLNPDKYDVDKQFAAMMPSATEMKLQAMRDAVKDGGLDALFDAVDEEE